MKTVLLKNLKSGVAFTFLPLGAVFLRVSGGGYRPARGGVLVKFSHDQKVYRFLTVI